MSFRSSYGNTPEPSDPHEFGWFWRSRLPRANDLDTMADEELDQVDWLGLEHELTAIRAARDARPTVYKCAGMGFYAARVALELRDSLFLYIERDLVGVAASTIQARRARYQDERTWYGFKFPGWEELRLKYEDDPLRQVAEQVRWCDQAIRREVARIPSHRVLCLSYLDLVWRPFSVLDRVQEFARLQSEMVDPSRQHHPSDGEWEAIKRLLVD